MKKLFLSLLIAIACLDMSAQYNYYNFTAGPLTTTVTIPTSSGNGIIMTPNSNLFYRSNYGYMCNTYLSGGNWYSNVIWSSIEPKTTSNFAYGDNKVFYVDINNRIRQLYYNGSWQNGELNSTLPAANGTGLVFAGNSTLYYNDINDNVIKVYFNGTGWVKDATLSAMQAKTNSVFTYGDNKLIYVGKTDNKLHQLYYSGYWENSALNSGSPDARGDGLVFGSNSNIYYTTSVGNICNIFYSSGWTSNTVWSAVTAKTGSKILCENNVLYYVGSDDFMYTLSYDHCAWFNKKINKTAKPKPEAICLSSGKIYFRSTLTASLNVVSEAKTLSGSNPAAYLKGKSFIKSNGQEFYPIAVNYAMDLKKEGSGNIYGAPHHSYFEYNSCYCTTQSAANALLDADFAKISALGFNTIRLTGASITCDNNSTAPLQFSVLQDGGWVATNWSSTIKSQYLTALDNVIARAANYGLKVMLLTGGGYLQRTDRYVDYSNYLEEISEYYKNNSTLIAYDLYNEPGSFAFQTGVSLTKQQTCEESKYWYDHIRAHDNNHLITIGLFGRDDAFYWDPSLVSLDFHSFHFYDFSPYNTTGIQDQNEIQAQMSWMKDNITTPWIVGEASFSATRAPDINPANSNNCNPANQQGIGTEAQQQSYAAFTLEKTRGSGGSGYSWWGYHDVYHDNDAISQNFQGIYTRCGNTKPITTEFNKNWLSYSCDNNTKNNNYYYRNTALAYSISGVIKDAANLPIKDAVISIRGAGGPNGHTLTKSDGTYTVYASTPITRFDVTALGKEFAIYYPQNNATNQNITGYNINLSTITSCSVSTNIKLAQPNLSTYEQNRGFSLFPNPASNEVFIKSENLITKILVWDMKGVLVKEFYPNNINTSLNTADWAPGIYSVQCIGETGSNIQKLIINK